METFKKQVIVLAAGCGKRMLPLTQEIPKCLLDVDGGILQLVHDAQLQLAERLGAFVFQGPNRNHRQAAVELGGGHGITRLGPAECFLEPGVGLAFVGHDKSRSHLNTGRPHHQ